VTQGEAHEAFNVPTFYHATDFDTGSVFNWMIGPNAYYAF
jgi:hypothetical protein